MADDGSQQPKPDFRTAVEDGKALATVLVMKLESVASSRQPTGEKRWPHIVVILSFVMFVLAAFAIIVLGYLLQLKWTGVTGKTFWHWLGLLFAPVLLSGGGFLIYTLWTWSDHRAKEKAAHEAARQGNLDQIAQNYLDNIQELMLDREAAGEEAKLSAIARARTFNVFETLDPIRKGNTIRFLFRVGLLTAPKKDPPKNENKAEPDSSDPEQGAPLKSPFFIKLKGANLRGAYLPRATLQGGASFAEALLEEANFQKANLEEANFQKANLEKANLQGANLWNAILTCADLRNANLKGAQVTDEQLIQAKSLEGATMPNGQTLRGHKTPNGPTFKDWLKSKDRAGNGEIPNRS
jgi:hypothetical protein